MSEPSVLLIGGSGFIGSHVAARLAGHALSIVVPTRHEAHAMHLMPLGVDIVEADIHDDATLRRLVAGKRAVINLVGILYAQRGTPYGEAFRRAHVELPWRIVEACAAAGVPRYLHMSALGADPQGPSMYQRSKGDGEQAAQSNPAVAATIFRPSVVFGEDDNFLNMFARLQRHLPFMPLPDGLARLEAMFFELLPGTPMVSRDNLDSMKIDNVINQLVNPSTQVLTAKALGIKLTALEAVAPQYLSPTGRIDVLRARAGR
jgi:uncharacterized protein YbjT (DUF2867 family)